MTILEDIGEPLFEYLTEALEECGAGVPRPCAGNKGTWHLRYQPEDEDYGDGSCIGAYLRPDIVTFHSGDLAEYDLPEGSRSNCDIQVALDVLFGMKRCIAVVESQGQQPTPKQAKADAEAIMDDMVAMSKAIARFARDADQLVDLETIERDGEGGCYTTEARLRIDMGGL